MEPLLTTIWYCVFKDSLWILCTVLLILFVCFYTSRMLFFAFVCSLGCSVYDTLKVLFQFCPCARVCERTAEDIVDHWKFQQLPGLQKSFRVDRSPDIIGTTTKTSLSDRTKYYWNLVEAWLTDWAQEFQVSVKRKHRQYWIWLWSELCIRGSKVLRNGRSGERERGQWWGDRLTGINKDPWLNGQQFQLFVRSQKEIKARKIRVIRCKIHIFEYSNTLLDWGHNSEIGYLLHMWKALGSLPSTTEQTN